MSLIDEIAVWLAAQRPITEDTPPGATVKAGVLGGGDVYWASCERCRWWASDDDEDRDSTGFVTEAQAGAQAAAHNVRFHPPAAA